MKIEKNVRDAFLDQLDLNKLIKDQVDSRRKLFDADWHFVWRLKTEESFALKVQAGICDSKLVIDDFYGCTYVVRNSSEIARATKIVEENFLVVKKRPPAADTTKSEPTDFRFDDLRMYVRLLPSVSGPRPIDEVTFEIQIKTFLQHAWGIATHDLTYKTDEVSWARFRVASQIRAMLEHAELSIESFDRLAESEIIAKKFDTFVGIHQMIVSLRERFETNALPIDLQRLAKSILAALHTLGVKPDLAMKYLDAETAVGKGVKELDLSPYSIVIKAVLIHHPFVTKDLRGKIGNRRYTPLMLSESVKIPASLEFLRSKLINVF